MIDENLISTINQCTTLDNKIKILEGFDSEVPLNKAGKESLLAMKRKLSRFSKVRDAALVELIRPMIKEALDDELTKVLRGASITEKIAAFMKIPKCRMSWSH